VELVHAISWDEVIDHVHVLASRQNANRGLVFGDRNQQPIHDDDDHEFDDDDSTYAPFAGDEDDDEIDDAGVMDNLDDENRYENHYDDVVDNIVDNEDDQADEDVHADAQGDDDYNKKYCAQGEYRSAQQR
jgi:hypothetical protein